MPLKLAAPTEETFELERSDALYGTDGEPTRVTIRQATQAQNEKRSRVFSELQRVFKAQQEDEEGNSFTLRSNWTNEELKRTEAFLTMVDCNLLDEDDKPLFRFKKRKGDDKQYLDMSTHEFSEAWGRLPPIIANEIHEKVLEVNLTWGGPLAT